MNIYHVVKTAILTSRFHTCELGKCPLNPIPLSTFSKQVQRTDDRLPEKQAMASNQLIHIQLRSAFLVFVKKCIMISYSDMWNRVIDICTYPYFI